jgi:uncharacterized membrane protein
MKSITNDEMVLELTRFYYVYEPEQERFAKYREFAIYWNGILQMCSQQQTFDWVKITDKGYVEVANAYNDLVGLGYFEDEDEDLDIDE